MKRIIITVFILININNDLYAQKYTDTYIKDANKTALHWLDQINQYKYEEAYSILHQELKNKFEGKKWINQITELMLEFGKLNNRSLTDISFNNTLAGFGDGFYVFIEYSSDYTNTKNHIEYLKYHF